MTWSKHKKMGDEEEKDGRVAVPDRQVEETNNQSINRSDQCRLNTTKKPEQTL